MSSSGRQPEVEPRRARMPHTVESRRRCWSITTQVPVRGARARRARAHAATRPRSRSASSPARRDIPVQFLERLFATLRRGGILQSQRGVKGGYSFARHPRRSPCSRSSSCSRASSAPAPPIGRDLVRGRGRRARRARRHDDRRCRRARGARRGRVDVLHLEGLALLGETPHRYAAVSFEAWAPAAPRGCSRGRITLAEYGRPVQKRRKRARPCRSGVSPSPRRPARLPGDGSVMPRGNPFPLKARGR